MEKPYRCAEHLAHLEKFLHIEETIKEIKIKGKEQGDEIEKVKEVSTKTLASYKSLHLRVTKVEDQTAAIFELSGSVRELASNVANVMGNLQKQEDAVNERFEKQAIAIDKKFEDQKEVIQSLATEQNKASLVPGAFALKAWWFVIGGIAMQGIALVFKIMATGK